jgi:hypothetical protein
MGQGSSESDSEDEGPLSVVILLRESKVSSLDRLRHAGERAFGVPFSDEKNSQYFVVRSVLFTVIKAGIHTLSFVHFAKSYFEGESAEFGAQMPQASQREAWMRHCCWEAIDYVRSGQQPEVEYAVIARMCLQLLDSNCVGVYLPRDSVFVPNDGSALEFLQSMAQPFPPA